LRVTACRTMRHMQEVARSVCDKPKPCFFLSNDIKYEVQIKRIWPTLHSCSCSCSTCRSWWGCSTCGCSACDHELQQVAPTQPRTAAPVHARFYELGLVQSLHVSGSQGHQQQPLSALIHLRTALPTNARFLTSGWMRWRYRYRPSGQAPSAWLTLHTKEGHQQSSGSTTQEIRWLE